MANLNWYWIYVPYLDEPDRQAESALRAGYNKVVFKDEADKVIEKKDKEIAKLKEQVALLQAEFIPEPGV